jgi:diguanylate cyclase (GGDEF)-like protein
LAAALQRRRPLILVVDDDPVMRLMATENLQRSGFDTAEADAGERGIESFERLRPDLVLLDVEMPGLDGFQVCEAIRASRRGRHVPILILTGLDNVEAIDRAYRSGATDFSSKPVHWLVLAQRIRYILRASESFLAVRLQQLRLNQVQRLARLSSWEIDLAMGSFSTTQALHEILGLGDCVGTLDTRMLLERVHPDDRAALVDSVRESIERSTGFSLDHRIVKSGGSERIVHTQARVRAGLDGEGDVLEGFTQDITERRHAEAQIRYLACHDSLTGLGNRAAFKRRVWDALQVARRSGRMLAVLHLDLDHFKRINETFGHEAGDALLRSVADRLVDSVRASDCVARAGEPDAAALVSRLGGDEFTILLDGIADPQEAGRVALRVSGELSRPLRVENEDLVVTSSVGIAVSPQDGRDAEELLRNADSAMYHAKQGGRANFQFYSPELNAHALERLQLEARLRRAVDGGELQAHYQPRLELRTGRVTGCEALLRWQDAERGSVPPAEFIPLAEKIGLIGRLGEWVMERAMRDARGWIGGTPADFKLAINLSPAQLRDDAIVRTILRALSETGFAPDRLELEITESALIQNEARASVALGELRERGITISLDDFGTGYSSLSYLKRFPVQALKIDRSFIQGVGRDGQDTAITAAILSMARDLGLRVVAEGVETEEQRRFLAERGCDEIQGVLVSPPIPNAAFAELLREWRAPSAHSRRRR